MDHLTLKQAAFVREYLIDLNATQAAIRAGYSKKTAYSIGEELLRKPGVATAIKAAVDARAKRTEITQDYVLRTITDTIERCSHPDTFDPRAVLKGAELLARHLGMLHDRVEHTGANGGPIETTISDTELVRHIHFLLERQAHQEVRH